MKFTNKYRFVDSCLHRNDEGQTIVASIPNPLILDSKYLPVTLEDIFKIIDYLYEYLEQKQLHKHRLLCRLVLKNLPNVFLQPYLRASGSL